MCSDYYWREIEHYNPEDMWFQPEGATSHNATHNRAHLQDKFSRASNFEMLQLNTFEFLLVEKKWCLCLQFSNSGPYESNYRDIVGNVPRSVRGSV